MPEYRLNSWLFTALVVLVFIVLWAILEFVFFQIDLFYAVLLGVLTGLFVGLLSLAIRSRLAA